MEYVLQEINRHLDVAEDLVVLPLGDQGPKLALLIQGVTDLYRLCARLKLLVELLRNRLLLMNFALRRFLGFRV